MAKGDKCVTPPFRVCFPAVFEKYGFEGSEPKFSITAVFDPASFGKAEHVAWKRMHALAEEAAKEKGFKHGLKTSGVRDPFRDGADKDHLEGFGEGLIYQYQRGSD